MYFQNIFHLSNRAKILDLSMDKVKLDLVKVSKKSERASVEVLFYGWFDMEWPKCTMYPIYINLPTPLWQSIMLIRFKAQNYNKELFNPTLGGQYGN